ncbi:MAG: hypothetical protein LC649_00035 [Bacteroidales bacterium]|nr:hypothetical protein [Bacteroidales bacterium]
MKTTIKETAFDIFNEYVLSNEEMITVRGGDGDPEKGSIVPPVTSDPEL